MSSIVRTYFVQQNAYLLDDVNKLISYIISRVVFNLRFDLAELLYEYLTRTKMERSFVGSHVNCLRFYTKLIKLILHFE